MQTLIQDIRHSLRMLLKNRAFTLTALITLALGIGANSAVFSVINAVLLSALPYKNSERIVFLWGKSQKESNDRNTISLPDYENWKEQSRSFEAMGAYAPRAYNISGAGEPEAVQGVMASSGFFEAVGTDPALGRLFRLEDERENLVIIGHDLWQRRFNSDPHIIGQAITMSSAPYTVIGVMPAGFNFPRKDIDVWTSFSIVRNIPMFQSRGARVLRIVGRLKPGVSPQQAQAEMSAVAGRLEQQFPDTNTGVGINVLPLSEQLLGGIRLTLLFVWATVGLVLLIVCANLASLLMARTAARERELAIRTALGASRWRLIRQLLTETVVLSVIGGLLGLLLAVWGVGFLTRLSPADLPSIDTVRLDARWLLFTFILSLLSGLFFGLIPALQASKQNLASTLKEGGRGTSGSAHQRRLRGLVIISEMALALVLLVGAGLMISSFVRLNTVTPGFDAENLMTMQISFPKEKYQQQQQQVAFLERILHQLAEVPGTEEVALGMSLPPEGLFSRESFEIEGREEGGAQPGPTAAILPVSHRYFRALKIPLLAGREFMEADDRSDAPKVVIINQSFAKRFFPGADPLGKRIVRGGGPSGSTRYEIVGVVGDVKYTGLASEAGSQLYFPYATQSITGSYFMMRTRPDPRTMYDAVRKAVYSVDSEQPVRGLRTMDEVLYESLSQQRFIMFLLNFFAGLALLLTAVGLYGLIAYSVTQRTHEMGIRMALGAKPRHVLMLVLNYGLKLAAIGTAFGLLAAFAGTRLISSLLYGVSATNPLIFLGASLTLLAVALLACLIPARRASRVEPIVALREQ
ncbi:MAG: hypothetical protein QOH49_2336 [Acidobacteriota bacterium]|jgi:putative ABC transport system permease protein|nr:hypothetical protein [Acidobacteriota bacterium]